MKDSKYSKENRPVPPSVAEFAVSQFAGPKQCVNCPGRDDHDTVDCPLRCAQPATAVVPPVAWIDPAQLKALCGRDHSASCAVWNTAGGSRVPLFVAAAPIPAVQPTSEFLCDDGELQELLNWSVELATGSAGQDGAMLWKELLDSVLSRLSANVQQVEQGRCQKCESETAIETRRLDSAEAVELQRILLEHHRGVRPVGSGLMGWAAAVLAQQAEQVPLEVGEAGTMPGTDGFTMACFKASDVPVGTKLFTAPPAAPSQDARGLVEALEDLLDCPQWVEQATVPRAGIEACPEQVVCNMSVGLMRLRKARAALAAHKGDKS